MNAELDLATLFETYDRRLRRYVARRVPYDEVDDVMGNLWLEVVRQARSVPAEAVAVPLPAWLYRIASTQCWRFWRRARRKPTSPLPVAADYVLEGLRCDGGMEAVVTSCDTALATTVLRQALTSLPQHERQAALLLAHGLPGPVAARTLEISLVRYKQVISSALRHLSVMLAGAPPKRERYRPDAVPTRCQEPNCARPHYSRGQCKSHYQQAHRKRRRWAARDARATTGELEFARSVRSELKKAA